MIGSRIALFAVVFAALAALTFAAGSGVNLTVTSACTSNVNGNLTLSQNVSANGTCFVITADNVTFDCANHIITGNGSGIGIYAPNRTNITIVNCTINRFYSGIVFNKTNSSLMYNNSFDLNGKAGIFLIGSNSNNITKNLNTNTSDSCTYAGTQHCVYSDPRDESGIALCDSSNSNRIEDFTLYGLSPGNAECGVDAVISFVVR